MQSKITTSWPSPHLLRLHGAVTCQGQDWPRRDQERSSTQPERRQLLARFGDSASRQSDCWKMTGTEVHSQAWAVSVNHRIRWDRAMSWRATEIACQETLLSAKWASRVWSGLFRAVLALQCFSLNSKESKSQADLFTVVRRLKIKNKQTCVIQMGKISLELRACSQKCCKLVFLVFLSPSLLLPEGSSGKPRWGSCYSYSYEVVVKRDLATGAFHSWIYCLLCIKRAQLYWLSVFFHLLVGKQWRCWADNATQST